MQSIIYLLILRETNNLFHILHSFYSDIYECIKLKVGRACFALFYQTDYACNSTAAIISTKEFLKLFKYHRQKLRDLKTA